MNTTGEPEILHLLTSEEGLNSVECVIENEHFITTPVLLKSQVFFIRVGLQNCFQVTVFSQSE